MLDKIAQVFSDYILTPIMSIDWVDIIDIFLLAVIFYFVVTFVRDRRAR